MLRYHSPVIWRCWTDRLMDQWTDQLTLLFFRATLIVCNDSFSSWGTSINFSHLGYTLHSCLSHYTQHYVAIKTSCRKWKMRTIVTLPPMGFEREKNVHALLAAIQFFIFLPPPVYPLNCGCEWYNCSFVTNNFLNDTF